VVYTACLAPMGGVLRLLGTYAGVTRSVNATLTIRYDPSSVENPGLSPGGARVDSPTGKLVLLAVASTLVVGGVIVLVRGQRWLRPSPRPRSPETVEPEEATTQDVPVRPSP